MRLNNCSYTGSGLYLPVSGSQFSSNAASQWHWVRGHAGHEGNERADALANRGVPGRR